MKTVNSHSANGSSEVKKAYILRMPCGLTSKPYVLTEDGVRWMIEIVERQTAAAKRIREGIVECTFEFNEPDDDGNIYVDVVMDGNRYCGNDASGSDSSSIDSQGRDHNE